MMSFWSFQNGFEIDDGRLALRPQLQPPVHTRGAIVIPGMASHS